MKPNLLLLHGALGSSAELEPLKKLLNDQFSIYTFDFEGHGTNHGDKPFSMPMFARDLIRFMDENQIETAYVFGYSMGGYATLTAALEHSHRFKKIMTLGSKFGWSPEIAEGEIRLINPDKIEEKIPQYAAYLNSLHAPQDWKKIMHKLADMIHGLGNGKALTPDDFSRVPNKCFIGVGEADTMVGIEETKAVADAIPNAMFYTLKDVKHPISTVNPELIKEKILEFFISEN